MSEEIERIIKECSGVDTFDYIITPQQRDTMRLAEYIKKLQQENQQLREKIDEELDSNIKYNVEIVDLQQENQQLKEQLKDENNYHNEAVKWYKEAFDIEQERIKYRNVLDEIREYINNYDVFKEFSFPLMKRDEENQVKSSIDYEFQTSIKKSLLQILDKVKE